MRWTVQGERDIYASEWVTVALADVEIPGGERFEHHVVHVGRPASGVIVRNDADELLLLWRHRFITDTWGYEIPAGGIDPGESPVDAGRREVLEETGLVVELWGPLLWTTYAKSNSLGFDLIAETYVAHAVGGEINIDDPDGIVTACRYFPLDEAIEALEATWVPTRQPLLGWLDERWQAPRQFSYSVEGDRSTGLIVELLSQT